MFVDGSLPAVVRLDDGRDEGAKEEDGGQAAVGNPDSTNYLKSLIRRGGSSTATISLPSIFSNFRVSYIGPNSKTTPRAVSMACLTGGLSHTIA